MKSGIKRVFFITRRIIFGILCLLLVSLGCELAARAWLTAYPEYTYRDYITTPSPAYTTASYWSDDFRTAVKNLAYQWGCQYNQPYTYNSRYFNVEKNCRRHVIGQLNHTSHTIWMFGNSTLFSPEVPDEYTIASQLQALIKDWRVVNITTGGAGLRTMQSMIEDQSIQNGDIVITYSGITDTPYGEMRRATENSFESACEKILAWRNLIAMTRVLCDWQSHAAHNEIVQKDFIKPYLMVTEKRYKETTGEIHAYLSARGAYYINVLQPQMWSRPLTDAEQKINNGPFVMPLFGQVVSLTWPHLQPYADLDLTHLLDGVRNTEVVFFEGFHGNHTANKVVAHALYDAIIKIDSW